MWRHGVVTSIVRFLCGEDKEQVEEEYRKTPPINTVLSITSPMCMYIRGKEGRKEPCVQWVQIQSVDIIWRFAWCNLRRCCYCCNSGASLKNGVCLWHWWWSPLLLRVMWCMLSSSMAVYRPLPSSTWAHFRLLMQTAAAAAAAMEVAAIVASSYKI